jgi:hypothetical protein
MKVSRQQEGSCYLLGRGRWARPAPEPFWKLMEGRASVEVESAEQTLRFVGLSILSRALTAHDDDQQNDKKQCSCCYTNGKLSTHRKLLSRSWSGLNEVALFRMLARNSEQARKRLKPGQAS